MIMAERYSRMSQGRNQYDSWYMVDVTENPRGVIGARSFGSDPVRVADLGVAYAKGVESGE